MKFQNFTIILKKDGDQGWHASVQELSGCHSFGSTPEEAKASVVDAIYLHTQNKPILAPAEEKIVDHITLAMAA